MNKELAFKIKELRTGKICHSARRIAEIICDSHPDYIREEYGDPTELHGNQLLGNELMKEAKTALGISDEEYCSIWI